MKCSLITKHNVICEERSEGDGRKIERKLSEVSYRAISRGQSEMVGDVISNGGRL